VQVRDWYVESFRELKAMPPIRDTTDELRFTGILKHIYQRHAHVVPTMAR
jgi:pyruvate dehydrogenase kinase 2/3/4